jgi:hypothetical protein
MEPSWKFGQVIMKQSDFLKSLQLFPQEQINEKMIDLLQIFRND